MTPGFETEEERFQVAGLIGSLMRELKQTDWRFADQLDELIDILLDRIEELEVDRPVVNDPAELDKLPFMTVIMEIDDSEPRAVFCKMLDDMWATFGDTEQFHWSQIQLPVQVVLPGVP